MWRNCAGIQMGAAHFGPCSALLHRSQCMVIRGSSLQVAAAPPSATVSKLVLPNSVEAAELRLAELLKKPSVGTGLVSRPPASADAQQQDSGPALPDAASAGTTTPGQTGAAQRRTAKPAAPVIEFSGKVIKVLHSSPTGDMFAALTVQVDSRAWPDAMASYPAQKQQQGLSQPPAFTPGAHEVLSPSPGDHSAHQQSSHNATASSSDIASSSSSRSSHPNQPGPSAHISQGVGTSARITPRPRQLPPRHAPWALPSLPLAARAISGMLDSPGTAHASHANGPSHTSSLSPNSQGSTPLQIPQQPGSVGLVQVAVVGQDLSHCAQEGLEVCIRGHWQWHKQYGPQLRAQAVWQPGALAPQAGASSSAQRVAPAVMPFDLLGFKLLLNRIQHPHSRRRDVSLSVSDITSMEWCALRTAYQTASGSVQRTTAFMARGSEIHLQIEMAVIAEQVDVPTPSDEDQLAVRLLNMVAAMRQLLVEGITRELRMYANIWGEWLSGVVDQLQLTEGGLVSLTETKTRGLKKPVPLDVIDQAKIQVMVYHEMYEAFRALTLPALHDYLFTVSKDHVGLDPDRPLDPELAATLLQWYPELAQQPTPPPSLPDSLMGPGMRMRPVLLSAAVAPAPGPPQPCVAAPPLTNRADTPADPSGPDLAGAGGAGKPSSTPRGGKSKAPKVGVQEALASRQPIQSPASSSEAPEVLASQVPANASLAASIALTPETASTAGPDLVSPTPEEQGPTPRARRKYRQNSSTSDADACLGMLPQATRSLSGSALDAKTAAHLEACLPGADQHAAVQLGQQALLAALDSVPLLLPSSPPPSTAGRQNHCQVSNHSRTDLQEASMDAVSSPGEASAPELTSCAPLASPAQPAGVSSTSQAMAAPPGDMEVLGVQPTAVTWDSAGAHSPMAAGPAQPSSAAAGQCVAATPMTLLPGKAPSAPSPIRAPVATQAELSGKPLGEALQGSLGQAAAVPTAAGWPVGTVTLGQVVHLLHSNLRFLRPVGGQHTLEYLHQADGALLKTVPIKFEAEYVNAKVMSALDVWRGRVPPPATKLAYRCKSCDFAKLCVRHAPADEAIGPAVLMQRTLAERNAAAAASDLTHVIS